MKITNLLWVWFIGSLAGFLALAGAGLQNQFYYQFDNSYGALTDDQLTELLNKTKEMFYFAYDNYMKYAFPKDELDPIHCTGRGPDYENPSNININDVLGGYSLTLVDTLDTLAIMGNSSEFLKAVKLVLEHVHFDVPSTVQVFEATIRVMGALLSAHLIIKDPVQPFGSMTYEEYDDELLALAHDLGTRLLPAFEDTATGIPHPRVHLQNGVPHNTVNETCTAGAGTLLVEFGVLSRLLKDPTYEGLARRTIDRLWALRSNVTGLFGNTINIQTGKWVGYMSGLGAGIDSFYEYFLKAYILFGHEEDMNKFNESYESIKYYMRKGRKLCNSGSGFPPIYTNVNMWTGELINYWIDSLQASWPALLILFGDLEEAICAHAVYYAIWQRYGALPERYNWNLQAPDVLFYPLRPELVESTYYLYQATKNPFYLHVGREILNSLNNHSRVECGYATLHDVTKKTNEDRMESFFLGETCKYLYLLFDVNNHVNKEFSNYIFSTEGHLFPVLREFRKDSWSEMNGSKEKSGPGSPRKTEKQKNEIPSDMNKKLNMNGAVVVDARGSWNHSSNCVRIPEERRFELPIRNQYLQQVRQFVGLL